jgi:hypothetical protein
MSDFKDIADVADRLIYEVIALLLPGTLFALLILAVTGPEVMGADGWSRGMRFASEHVVIMTAVAYALGYVVQGLSRPIAHRLATTLDWLWRSLESPRRGVSNIAVSMRTWIETAILGWPSNTPTISPDESGKTVVRLDHLVATKLADRLGLRAEERLSAADLQDLTFSALIPDVKRLERFRAAASCARGLATVVAVGWLLFVSVLILGFVSAKGMPSTWHAWLALTVLTVAFRALIRRERMYESLWRGILAPQFLVATSTPANTPNGPSTTRAE